MKIGVFFPTFLPLSLRTYAENITQELEILNVQCIYFSQNDPLPESVDIYWDPRAAGGSAPYNNLRYATKPLVLTLHGAAPFSLPIREYTESLSAAFRVKLHMAESLYHWRTFREQCAAIITVSSYAKEEIKKYLNLDEYKIIPIYHGINHTVFHSTDNWFESQKPYYLHVSSYQPKKNVNRVINAYRQLSSPNKIHFKAVIPNYKKHLADDNIELIRKPMLQQELVPLYQNATGFVFPSLQESFGFPIIEAMACGCPVITSNTTACAEIAGDAALLVNPRSVNEIAEAMQRLITDSELRQTLRVKGIERSHRFTWKKSALEHLTVFQSVLDKTY